MDIDNGIEIFKQGNEHYYIGNVDTVTHSFRDDTCTLGMDSDLQVARYLSILTFHS